MRIYNTKGNSIQEFVPIKPNQVGMYSCGPTVYGDPHIGNMRAYVVADIIKRAFMYSGYKVTHVMNITDVGHLTGDADHGEDKMAKAAAEQRKTAWQIADEYTQVFHQAIKDMNIIPSSIECKATDHIQEQITLIKQLEAKGVTYALDDGVYFDTSKIDYGTLGKVNREDQEAGKRIDIKGKKNPTDFALWKFSPKDEQRDMEWDSPWGKGFPGWHIECSAMSMKYLGEHFDVHTGGIDHVPIHHTNEIAQSETATGKTYVNYWMHNNFIVLKDEKMSKSLGNVITIEILKQKGYNPLAFRYYLLGAHYRSPITFTYEALDGAGSAYDKLIGHVKEYEREGTIIERFLEPFKSYVNEDINTPRMLALLWDVVKSDAPSGDKFATLIEFDKVLGLDIEKASMQQPVPQEVEDLRRQRQELRDQKDFAGADGLRDQINALGFDVVDTPEGSHVKAR